MIEHLRKKERHRKRRIMARRHKRRMMRIVTRGFMPWVVYVDEACVDGVWKPVGKYVKLPKNSNGKQYWKRHSNKVIRRRREVWRGNQYRKCFDYQWTIS